jgi:fructose-1,6-bisphosphatase I
MDASILQLSADNDNPRPTLVQHLTAWAGDDPDRAALAHLIGVIAEAAVPLARRLALGSRPGDPTAIVGVNDSGDRVKALDLAAHDHFVTALRSASVRTLLSEEDATEISVDPEGRFAVAMDPVDGSGSIGIGAPLGTLFCVFPADGGFLRPGRDIIAAGYASFGHTTDFGFSLGNGVDIATLDPRDGTFRIESTGLTVPPKTNMVAFNASNRRRWAPGLAAYIDDCMDGKAGPRGHDFNMRWIAAAVGDLHRILRQGGLILFPADARAGYGDGFLRLAYEAFPIAWLIEQAGGAAIDGAGPILDLVPATNHARVPLIFGSRDEVAVLQAYLEP